MKASLRLFLPVCLAFVAAAGLLLLSCSKDEDDNGTSPPSWTIMMYGAGNNNLDVSNNNTSFIIQDVQDMEKVGSQPGLNLIAMVASERTGGLAKYYRLEYHPSENPDQISSPMLADKGTKDMSDPATLKEFLNYCKTHYPAQRYLLIVDDHGAGWPGSCSDELNGGGGLLTMIELKNAIAQSDLQRVDIVTFHACLMAMVEVGYELRNVASYLTACQFTMPMQNILGADLWLAWLKDNLGASPVQLAQKIAEKVRVAAENKQKTSHYAMMDLSQMQTLGARIGSFGNILVTEAGQHWSEVQHAWGQTHTTQYDNPAYVDLREFANKIRAEPTLSTINLVSNAAQDIINSVNAAVPYTACYFHPPDQAVPRGGMSIHFPYQLSDFDSANYVALDFRQTNWHAFLSTFLRAAGPPPAQCPGQCAQAAQISVGQTISQCAFTEQSRQHWFRVTLNPGMFRFQLGGFPNGADYDCYTFLQCGDFPDNPTDCSGQVVGPEDFNCNVQGGAVEVFVLINAYGGPYGGYTFSISQVGALPEGGSAPVITVN